MKSKNLILIGLLFISILLISGCNSKKSGNGSEESFSIQTDYFGTMPDGDSIFQFTMKADTGIIVKILNYGGIVTEIITPDRNGNPGNIVLGFDNLDQYLAGHPYFGALIGRYGNRIADAAFTLDGNTYTLARNNGKNSLHGGIKGFDKVVWEPEIIETEKGKALQLRYNSQDMEEGFPGNLKVSVIYELIGKDLEITYKATTDKPTPVNLTNHSYFNLAGEGTILDHLLELKASHYTPVNQELIPTGEIAPVEGTPFNFMVAKPIGRDIENTAGGYDHNYVVDREFFSLEWIGRLEDPKSGRILDIYTTEPGVQFYSGNFLDGSLKSGEKIYSRHSGLCLETQHFPDSPNQREFPSTILRPGETYRSKTVYRFDVAEN